MAGSYTKKEFGIGPEEQTLLKDSNGTRIVPSKGERSIYLFTHILNTQLCTYIFFFHFARDLVCQQVWAVLYPLPLLLFFSLFWVVVFVCGKQTGKREGLYRYFLHL